MQESKGDQQLEKRVASFIGEIARGPFKCLNAYDGKSPWQHVEVRNPGVGDIFDCAVYQAYLDMCRTVSGAGKSDLKEKLEETRSIVAETLRDYFSRKPKENEEAFDGWYNSMAFQAGVPARLTIGKVQKLFNMAFKYLYCCEDFRSEHHEHFSFCHMPLDSYTLAWYKRECDPGYDGEAWSAINDIAKYGHIVDKTRKKLEGKVVLEEEFSIWAAEKARFEREDVKKAVLKVAAYDGCPEELKEQLVSYIGLLTK